MSNQTSDMDSDLYNRSLDQSLALSGSEIPATAVLEQTKPQEQPEPLLLSPQKVRVTRVCARFAADITDEAWEAMVIDVMVVESWQERWGIDLEVKRRWQEHRRAVDRGR